MPDLIPDEERAERVREYLARRREVTPMIDGERFDTIHDIDLGSAGHVKLLASDLEVLARRPSPLTREALEEAIRSVTDYWPTPLGSEEVAQVALALSRFSLPEPAEVDWEYGLVSPEAEFGEYGRDDRAHLVSNNREHIEKQWRRGHPSIQFVKCVKAGQWVPAKGTEQ